MGQAHWESHSLAQVRKLIAALVSLLVLVLSTDTALEADAQDTAASIGAFALQDVDGRRHTADEWRQHKAVVLFFIATECPVANGYAPEMQGIADKYAASGVACYGIHCDPATTAQIAAEHAKQFELRIPIWLDPAQTLARAAQVRVTPEAVVVAPGGKILYRGRIDDRYAANGKRRDDPTVRDVESVLEQILAGAEPTVRVTKAFGCPLPKPAPSALIDAGPGQGAAGPK